MSIPRFETAGITLGMFGRGSAWFSVILNEFGSVLQHLGLNEKQVESSEGGHGFFSFSDKNDLISFQESETEMYCVVNKIVFSNFSREYWDSGRGGELHKLRPSDPRQHPQTHGIPKTPT